MTRRGFKMFLYPGTAEEYGRHHDKLWPEMKEVIRRHGGKNYSIFPDGETSVLYGYPKMEDEALWTGPAGTPINRKWWDYMADITEANRDNNPVYMDFRPVFYLD